MNFFKQVIHRSTALLFLAIFIAAIGIHGFFHMPRSLFPEVSYPRVVVEVNMGFTPLQSMEWGVTSVLENELRSVPGVRLVKSSTSRGTSTIDVFLRESEDINQSVQRVESKVAEARALIPGSAQITVRPITAAAFPGAEYCFSSKTKNARDLRSFVEYTLRPMVLPIPGVFKARVLGGDLATFSVKLDPRKLAEKNLQMSDIDDRIRNSNFIDFIGPVEHEGQEILAFGGKLFQAADDIGKTVVDSSLGRSIRVKDLGQVSLDNAWKYKDISLNGEECVLLDIFYQMGIDQSLTSQAIRQTIQDLIESNKSDYSYHFWDLNDFTDMATNAVLVDLAIGMVIIGLVTFLFLQNFRYSLFALLTMPLAASMTFLVMQSLGLTINLMTLGGLTAAIGLVVDNTVIVLEMYHYKKSLKPETPIRTLLLEVLTAVAKPMIFGTATIAMVFTPIGFLSGVSGMFSGPWPTCIVLLC